MIQDTSLKSYLKEIYPHLVSRQRPVLHYLRNAGGDHTNAEIAAALNWPVNRVTPRTGELVKMGLILKVARRTCKATNGTAWSLKAKYPVLPPARDEKKVEVNNSLFK
jgi:hypothetical protein